MKNNNDNATDWLLSKTLFLKGRQCLKALYLHKYHHTFKTNEESTPDKARAKGYRFEQQFRDERFPHGFNMVEKHGFNYAKNVQATREFIYSDANGALFEAAIVSCNIIVLTDVLYKHSNGQIEFYEIKNSSALKPESMWDLSLQYYVCKSAYADKLESFHVVLQGSRHRFKLIEISNQAEKRFENIKLQADQYIDILTSGIEPNIEMGNQCNKPYRCMFFDYCLKQNKFEKL